MKKYIYYGVVFFEHKDLKKPIWDMESYREREAYSFKEERNIVKDIKYSFVHNLYYKYIDTLKVQEISEEEFFERAMVYKYRIIAIDENEKYNHDLRKARLDKIRNDAFKMRDDFLMEVMGQREILVKREFAMSPLSKKYPWEQLEREDFDVVRMVGNYND